MRLHTAVLAPALLLPLAALAARRPPALPAPQEALIVTACTPAHKPGVNRPTITIKRTDNVVWDRGPHSPLATSWTIAPKNASDWLFAQKTFTGTPGHPATTPTPLPSAKAGHPYAYRVTVVCKDGTTQHIDPDIIISTS